MNLRRVSRTARVLYWTEKSRKRIRGVGIRVLWVQPHPHVELRQGLNGPHSVSQIRDSWSRGTANFHLGKLKEWEKEKPCDARAQNAPPRQRIRNSSRAEQRWAAGKSQQRGHPGLSPMAPLSKPKGLQKEETVGAPKFLGTKGRVTNYGPPTWRCISPRPGSSRQGSHTRI